MTDSLEEPEPEFAAAAPGKISGSQGDSSGLIKLPPARLTQPRAGELQLWAWSLDRNDLGEDCLSPDELQRANRFHFADDRRRFIAARVGLRTLLAQILDARPAELKFAYAEFGKPSLGNQPNSSLRFNLSHSGELALAVVSNEAEVGVDIERHRPCDQAQAIAQRHFTHRESNGLQTAPPREQQQRFFDLWTGKEAVIKLLGSGLRFPLTAFETPDAAGASGRIALPSVNPLGIDACWLLRLEVADTYSAAVAMPDPPTKTLLARLAF